MTAKAHKATYTEGSVFRHISSLAMISAIGMFAIMIVDLVDMYFISILGAPSMAAAVRILSTYWDAVQIRHQDNREPSENVLR